MSRECGQLQHIQLMDTRIEVLHESSTCRQRGLGIRLGWPPGGFSAYVELCHIV